MTDLEKNLCKNCLENRLTLNASEATITPGWEEEKKKKKAIYYD